MSETTKTRIKDYTELALKTALTIIGVLGLLILNDMKGEVKDLNKFVQTIDSRVKILEFINKDSLKDFYSNK